MPPPMHGYDRLDPIDAAVKAEFEEAKAAFLADKTAPGVAVRYRAAKKVLDQRRTYWRTLGESLGQRRIANVTNYVEPDGTPITDTPEAEAYWAKVESAKKAGVPKNLSTTEVE